MIKSGHMDVLGYTQEKQSAPNGVVINGTYTFSVVFTLTWNDEIPEYFMMNKPDTFQITVTSPSGVINQSKQVLNDASGKGTITLAVNYPRDSNITKNNGTGKWKVVVDCIDAGDQVGQFIGLRKVADTGNNWRLTINYQYLVANNTN